ncbi:MAG: Heavy-metal-associated domain protein [Bacteroidetes bacterium]|jgi:periplasmic mercuric ion binding protein|nr:Heavy-metal-associated domain protein [Bacteroidota bacterium]
MKTRRIMAAIAVVLLSVGSVYAKDLRTVVFKVVQMECENCEKKVVNNMKFEKGLKKVNTDLKSQTVTITYDAEKTTVEKLKDGFKKFKYEAEFLKESKIAESK